MVRYQTLFCFATLLILLPVGTARGELIVHRGISFWIYRVDPKDMSVELHLADKQGEPNTFPKLKERIEQDERRIKFAMNAGIFEGNFLPTGLHVSEGKQVTPINSKDFVKQWEGQFTDNFFLKPNGVFCILSSGTAAILETEAYRQSNFSSPVHLATQSGPLLVENGKIHPVLTENSTSIRYRNGVGITTDGMIVFACSLLEGDKGESNLYQFAELFRNTLKCSNALYLDGDISYIFIEGETPPIQESNFFAGILAVTEPMTEPNPKP